MKEFTLVNNTVIKSLKHTKLRLLSLGNRGNYYLVTLVNQKSKEFAFKISKNNLKEELKNITLKIIKIKKFSNRTIKYNKSYGVKQKREFNIYENLKKQI